MDIKLSIKPPWLVKVLEYANSRKLPIIIGMDSNAHSSLYGNQTNPRGEELEEIIINHGLFIENLGTKPTFQAARENGMIESTIDVTLSRGVDQRINNWRVMDGYNGSDHKTIRFEMYDVSSRREKVRLWDKTNWFLFNELIGKYNL